MILNEEIYYKKFNYILFITPSSFEDPRLTLDEINHKSELDVDWIYNKLEIFKEFKDN
jgi:hypothetical protein